MPDTAAVPKICRGCGFAKPLSEFSYRNPRAATRKSRCKECVRTASKEHYRRATGAYLERARQRRRSDRRKNGELVRAFLAAHPCVDCGESDPVVLDFDHTVPAEKTGAVARMISTASPGILRREIEKCEVRCANCHRVRSARQFGWTARLGPRAAP